MGTNEENMIENILCFIYGGDGVGSRTFAPHRLRPKSTGSDQKVPAPAPQHCLKHNNSPQKIRDYLLPIIFNTKAVAEAAEERAKSLYCSSNS